jgi:hypothetical protein
MNSDKKNEKPRLPDISDEQFWDITDNKLQLFKNKGFPEIVDIYAQLFEAKKLQEEAYRSVLWVAYLRLIETSAHYQDGRPATECRLTNIQQALAEMVNHAKKEEAEAKAEAKTQEKKPPPSPSKQKRPTLQFGEPIAEE